MLAVTAGLAGWTKLPYVFSQGVGAPLRAARHAASPWTVLTELARFLDARPELFLQLGLFSVFSLPFFTLAARSTERRLWGGSLYSMAVFAAFVLLPVLVVHVRVAMGPFLVAYVPCVIIAFLSALLVPSEGPVIL